MSWAALDRKEEEIRDLKEKIDRLLSERGCLHAYQKENNQLRLQFPQMQKNLKLKKNQNLTTR